MIEPALNPESGFSRFKVLVAYDGSKYFGWGKQPDQVTLQGTIEDAITRFIRIPAHSVVAGRTDAGVHATGQVFHVDVPEEFTGDPEHFTYRINQILPDDIRIISTQKAAVNFDARYSAIARRYRYKILDNNQLLMPLQRYDVATWFRPLDIDLMNQASAAMLGKHDFVTFCRYREGATSIRTLLEFTWHKDADGIAVCDIAADGFGWNMVRNLVGAAVCVGEGRFPKEWMSEILAGKERVADSYVFPAQGLTLTQVDYPADDQLLDRLLAYQEGLKNLENDAQSAISGLE
jgi:tRNA pseudouridine38-40 synthase